MVKGMNMRLSLNSWLETLQAEEATGDRRYEKSTAALPAA